eukprot:TRINITY_DN18168_c0_g1_i7.p1 TRINITY_DN18168_c0_g1~~TRINITY_DN18168_c0_g1_i7.p1  ORF type:complete len:226 (+),score=22.78 TRINITY_DN18168_c0_g1_i7:52-678(+)
MDQRADDAYTQEQSRLHCTSFWLHDGSSLRADRIITSEPDIARGSSADKGTSLHFQNRGSVSFTSTVHHARGLDGNSSSLEAQMCGFACFVKKLKAGRLGCGIIELISPSMREDVITRAQQLPLMNGVPCIKVRGVYVKLRRHVDNYRTTQRHDVLTSIFISWSHRVEQQSPLPLGEIVDAFDLLVAQVEAPQPVAVPLPIFPIFLAR